MTLIPNLIPILGVEFALLATSNVMTLTGAIAMIVAFGIAVDDTVHILNRIRLSGGFRIGVSVSNVEAGLRDSIPPIVMTSIILFIGFATTATSNLPTIASFGLLAAGATLLALIADLFLFPSFLRSIE